MNIEILNDGKSTKYDIGNILVTEGFEFHLMVEDTDGYSQTVVDLNNARIMTFDTMRDYEKYYPTKLIFKPSQIKLLLGD